MKLDAPALGRLSLLLDQALDFDDAAREAWFAAFPAEDLPWLPLLRELLSRRASEESADLLDRGPVFTAPSHGEAEPGSTFRAGSLVGAYRLLRELGRGGMGEVWLAQRDDGQLKREVALKLPTLGLRRGLLLQRFARERDILSGLVHPHIARLYDAGVAEDGQPYLALEYVSGQPIDVYCSERSLPIDERLRLLLQVTEAVAYAHSRLVLHRDLKPSNILVTSEGQVRLLDFGIAKLIEGDSVEASALTQASGRALTLEYASPEQVRGEPIGTSSDVYSLGVVAFELLASTRPYLLKRRSAAALEEAITGSEAPLASSLAEPPAFKRALAGDVDAILNKALKKSPADRYPTIDAMAQDLRRHLRGQRVDARPDSLSYRAQRIVRRHQVPLAASAVVVAAFVLAFGLGATALVVVALLAGLGAALWQARNARAQTRIAQMEAKTAEAVQNFLESIFRASSGDQVDPIKARETTAKQLLDRGVARIEHELDDAPRAKLRVLKTLGDMYEDMEQLEAAIKLRERRVVLAERLDGPESSTALHALSDLAHELVGAERIPEADSVLQRAARAQSRGIHDPEALIAFHHASGWYACHSNPAPGLSAIDSEITLLRQRPASVQLVKALVLKGGLLSQMNRPREALAAMKEATELGGKDGSRSLSTQSATLIQTASILWKLREFREAEQAYHAAIEWSRTHHGATSRSYVIAAAMYGQSLANACRVREAAVAGKMALDAVQTWPASPDRDSMLLTTSAVTTGAYIQLGHLDEAMTVLEEASNAAAQRAINPKFVVLMHSRRAAVFVEWGRYDEAKRELDLARDLISAAKLTIPNRVDAEALTRITLETRRRRPDAAHAALVHWQAATGRPLEPAADDLPGLHLASLSHAAKVDLQDARRLCEAALELAAGSPNADGAVLTGAQLGWLLGDVLLRGGAASEAQPVLRKALATFEELLDQERSLSIAGVRTSLAQSLMFTGDRAGARQAWSQGLLVTGRHRQLAKYYTEPLERLAAELSS